MKRIAQWLAVTALVGTAAFAQAAAGKPPRDPVPNLPGIGDPRGIVGASPEVAVSGGHEFVTRRRLAWIEVGCSTSTEMGCSGVLELRSPIGRSIGSARREIPESEESSFPIILPRAVARRASRRAGIKVIAVAEATDSLGRAAGDSARIRLVARR